MPNKKETQTYNERLKTFLREIEVLTAADTFKNPMHDIMDTVPFKDLETALMMARMEQRSRGRQKAA